MLLQNIVRCKRLLAISVQWPKAVVACHVCACYVSDHCLVMLKFPTSTAVAKITPPPPPAAALSPATAAVMVMRYGVCCGWNVLLD
jgi:hypothetical protein